MDAITGFMTVVIKILPALAVLIFAALAGQWWPAAGGIIAMFPVKAIGYALVLSSDGRAAIHAGTTGMLAGTFGLTLPLLFILWWWTRP